MAACGRNRSVSPRGTRGASARRRRLRLALFVGIVGVLVMVACRQDYPYNTLNPAGPVAERQDDLFTLVFWIAVGVFVVVEGLLVFTMIRFRRRGPDDAPTQIHGNTRLEIAWTIIPALLLAGVAVPTVGTIFQLSQRPAPGEAVEITVTGHQWWWEVEYPELDIVTANEIHVPTDKQVAVTLGSTDVIHSFWVPRLAGKQDVVPGRENHLTFAAPEPGVYRGQCAEFCGLSHANMRFQVVAEEPADFEAWAQGQASGAAEPEEGTLAFEGMELWASTGQCIGCHAISGIEGATARVGPDLTHVGGRRTFAAGLFDLNEENLTRWLEDAPALKPGSKMPSGLRDLNLTDDQIEAIVAYLVTLE
jgi:cytochrome c oxidase subunit 2